MTLLDEMSDGEALTLVCRAKRPVMRVIVWPERNVSHLHEQMNMIHHSTVRMHVHARPRRSSATQNRPDAHVFNISRMTKWETI